MKFHTLVLHNLNSLATPQPITIDFNQPPLRDCGLFAITGPTGAGKTTILDALTLALYGETAREGDERDVMSYGTAQCSAEVVFETPSGCFKVRWALRRARGKAQGALQPTEREFSDWKSKKILATKVADVNALVKEHVGLTKKQFLTSVLLAQGKFTEFLQAKEGERADLLEKLTGTELYRYLSVACFERQKEERQKLETLQQETEGIRLLSEAEKEALYCQQMDAQEEESLLREAIAQLHAEQHWHHERAKLEGKHAMATSQHLAAQNDLEVASPLLHQWHQHQLLLPLELPLEEWSGKQRQYQTLLQEAAERREELTLQTTQADALLQEKQALKELQDAALQRLQEAEPMLLQALADETRLQEQQKELLASQQTGQRLTEKAIALQEQWQTQQAKYERTKKAHADSRQWLHQHAADALLETVLPEATENYLALAALSERIANTQALLKSIGERQQKHYNAALQLRKQLDDAWAHLSVVETRLSNLLLQKQQWKQGISIAEGQLQKKETEMQARRNSQMRQVHALDFYLRHHELLEDGKPCQLCGSTVHPNAGHDVSAMRQEHTDRQHELTALEAALYELENQLQQYGQMLFLLADQDDAPGYTPDAEWAPEAQGAALEALLAEEQTLLAEQAVIHAECNQWTQQIETHQQACEEEAQAARALQEQVDQQVQSHARLRSYFETVARTHGETCPPDDEKKLLGRLRQRLEKYQQQQREAAAHVTEQAHIQTLLEKTQTDLEAIEHETDSHQVQLVSLQKQIELLAENIHGFCPAPYESVEAYHTTLKAAVQQATDAWNAVQHQYEAIEKERQLNAGAVGLLKQKSDALEAEAEMLRETLRQELEARNLPDEPEAARLQLLPQTERIAVGEKVERLQRNLDHALQLERQFREDIRQHLELGDYVRPLSVIRILQEQYQGDYDALQQNTGITRRILEEDAQRSIALADRKEQLLLQQQETDRWQALTELIGSGNGNRFAGFAQTLSLDHLLAYANVHLRQLSDRYQLRRKTTGKEELGIQVIDSYLGNTAREANTLSGGESFLVSLGLALGLSDMASQNTPIDSLFIDEGFGSLDADALEDALHTLENLQARGKTIGVISHVEALKERIPTQIVVRKTGDGTSTLEVTVQ